MSQNDPYAEFRTSEPADPYAEFRSTPSQPPAIAPSLLASRQAASASAFDANQPESTPWTRARELALGAAKGVGLTPQADKTSQAADTLKAVYGVIPGAIQAVRHPLDTASSLGSALAAGPSEAMQGIQSGNYDQMAHGVGQTISADLPAVAAVGGAGAAVANTARTAMAGGKVGVIEQAILRGAGSPEAKAVTASIAPELAQDPSLVRAALVGPEQFDKAAIAKFKGAQRLLNAAEQTVPPGTTVPKAPILSELDAKIQAASKFPTNPEIVANKQALKILMDKRAELSALPDDIPFKQLREFRQELDKDIANHKGWNETGTAVDRAEMMAQRDVVNAIRNQLRGNPALDAANKAYSLASDTVGASGINTDLERRLTTGATIGKPTTAQKAVASIKRNAVKGAALAAGGATGGALYEAYKHSQ